MDKHTLLFLHDTIADLSKNKHALTNVGVTIDQTQKMIGDASLYFNGSSRLFFDGAAVNFGSGDFTIDWWEYVTRSNSGSRFASAYTEAGTSNTRGLLLGYRGSAIYAGSYANAWDLLSNIPALSNTQNQWVHWAVVRNGNSFATYRNGTLFYSTTINGAIGPCDGTYDAVIGDYRGGDPDPFVGYLDAFRISNIARWTANFTPPSTVADYGLTLPLYCRHDDGWSAAQTAYVKIAGSWVELQESELDNYLNVHNHYQTQWIN